MFNSLTTPYTASVINTVESVTVTADPTIDGAAATIGEKDATDGEDVTLTEGETKTVTILVTATDGTTTKTYTLRITRAGSSSTDATLRSLTVSSGTLSPVFDKEETAYTVGVANSVESVRITARPTVSGATATIDGDDATDGHLVTLVAGIPKEVVITVTATDGSTSETYTVTVTRLLAAANDATLSRLTLSAGTLDPVFSPAQDDYEVEVYFETDEITITPTVNASGATVSYSPTDADGSTSGYQVKLVAGTPKPVDITVTATDGSTSETYTVTVTRMSETSPDATLSALVLVTGNLVPTFNRYGYDYRVSVGHDVGFLGVTPTAVGGAEANIAYSPSADADTATDAHDVVLNAGETKQITITVTSPDERFTRIYRIEATRAAAPSQDATLSELTLIAVGDSADELNQDFNPHRTEYTASVAHDVSMLTVRGTRQGATVAYTPVQDADTGTAGHQVAAPNHGASKDIRVIVTASGGRKQTYRIRVSRAQVPAQDATLSALTLEDASESIISFTPSFDPTIFSYTASVGLTAETITVMPSVNASGATVAYTPAQDADGVADGHQVTLDAGTTTITVTVTASGGRKQPYSLRVSRSASPPPRTSTPDPPRTSTPDPPRTSTPDPPRTSTPDPPTTRDPDPPPSSKDATLKALALSGEGTLAPSFASTKTAYTAQVGLDVETVTVTATATRTRTRVAITPADADPATAGHQIQLAEGANTITVVVTARDGHTKKPYTLIITRARPQSADATLKTLSVSGGRAVLAPAFAASTTAYTAEVGSARGIVTVAAEANAAGASVVITPGDADKPRDGHQVPLRSYGDNQVTIMVTAEDGTTKSYTLTVHRLEPKREPKTPTAPSKDATLRALGLSMGSISPTFAATTYQYAAQVGSNVATVTIVASAIEGASVAITPADTDPVAAGHQVALSMGDNTIAILVTAPDKTNKAYILTITRTTKTGATGLQALTISPGTLAPAFAATTYQYAAQVGSNVATVTIAASAVEGASVAITPADADPVAAGHQVALSVGDNTIAILVTAPDKTKKAYILTITRTTKTGATGLQFVGEVADQHYTAGAAIAPLVVPEATGGQGEVAYRMAGLPGGLSFAAATRTISGTPTTATGGAIEVACLAEDSAGTIAILSFAITVNPPLTFGNLFSSLKASGKNERGDGAAEPKNPLRFQAVNEQGEQGGAH